MKHKVAALNRMTILIPFIKYYLAQGHNLSTISALKDIPLEKLLDPSELLTSKVMNMAVVQMSSELKDQFLGFNIGWSMAHEQNGPFTELLRSSCSLSDTLSNIIRHFATESSAGSHQFSINAQFATISGHRNYDAKGIDLKQGDATFVGFFLGLIRARTTETWDSNKLLIHVTTPSVIPEDIIPKSCVVKTADNTVSIQFPSEWLMSKPFIREKITQDYISTISNYIFMFNPARTATIKEMATVAGMSEKELKSQLQNDDMTFSQLILSLKMNKAKELLLDSSNSIESIAFALNYISSANFCRAFKKYSGCTPLQYRQKNSAA
ncbi:AraC family transcriptional regulator [Vibrio breoganii]|uniref:AraC family transcriptional regulator n=1 Tax=Vibrio breoganii TaxID=553239 RepID=UPI000C814942|nr:AraC family transcriptional regulator [Vibrio breoganii]PMK30711.1 hypothetical protein BCU03_08770 [Vibrio breoganii]